LLAAALPGSPPRCSVSHGAQGAAHRLAKTEDVPPVREHGGKLGGPQVAMLEKVLQRPEGELRVVARQPDLAPFGVAVWQVISDLAIAFPPLARATERVPNGEAQKHALTFVTDDAS
jgi:hypothetical protein